MVFDSASVTDVGGAFDPSPTLLAVGLPSNDTTLEAQALVDDLLRSMIPAQKLEIVAQLNADTEALAVAGIKQRHPNADDHEQSMRLFALRLDPQTMIDAYGWDPSAHRS